MKTHRITSYGCAAALVALLVLPTVAHAGSALSGYGGPGEGNQAVLGSALIGGHRGGGSGGGEGSSGQNSSGQGSGAAESSGGGEGSAGGSGESSGSPGAETSGTGAAPTRGSGSSQPGTGSAASGHNGGGASQARSKESTDAGVATPQATLRGLYPAAERVPSGGQGSVLGLTGTDLLYVVLAVAALVFVGVLTWRLDGSAPSPREGG